MIGKLTIIGLIVAAVVFFMPGTSNVMHNFHLPEAISGKVSSDTESVKVPPNTESGKASPNTEFDKNQDVAHSKKEIKPIGLDQVNPKYVNKQNYTGQVFDASDGKCKVSVPGLAETINGKKELTHILNVEDCPYKLGEPVTVTKLDAKENIPQPVISKSSILVSPHSVNASNYISDYYDIIHLTSSHKGNDVLINYDDTSGKTIGVVVTLRNSDKEIFSGKFASPKFEAMINDVPNTPHIIEVIIEHSVYGTLHASVYVPVDSQHSTISGIFTKS